MLRSAIHLAALLALSVVATSATRAATTYTHDTGDGFYTVYYFDDNDVLKSAHHYGPEDEYLGSDYYDDSNPNPEGDGTGGAIDPDTVKDALDIKTLFGGGDFQVQEDPWKSLFGHTSWANNKGPSVTDPWKGSPWYDDPAGGGAGGGGSFDPNVPFGEQLPSQPGKSSDDDDDGPRRPDPADAQDFEPDVIDPSPEPEGGSVLFSSLLTEAGKTNGAGQGSQAGFVLLSPSTLGIRPGAVQSSRHGLDPQPIPWATFGGTHSALQRPGAAAGRGLR